MNLPHIFLFSFVQIDWDNRSRVEGKPSATIDGVHFRCTEPRPFWDGWYSHKFNAAGVDLEVGIDIIKGDICWINGLHRAAVPDINVFRDYF